MRFALGLFLFIALVATTNVAAQESGNAASTVDSLRAQLADTQAKESELQARLRQLDEDLKPENIERSLAGIGSTRPEELREQRRRQLSIERDGVLAQLRIVTTSRERLESVIRTAEAQAYQQSAEGNATFLTQNTQPSRWLMLSLAGVLGVLALVAVFALVKKAKTV